MEYDACTIYIITIVVTTEKGSLIQQDMGAQWYSHGEARGVLASLNQLNLSLACNHYSCSSVCACMVSKPPLHRVCLYTVANLQARAAMCTQPSALIITQCLSRSMPNASRAELSRPVAGEYQLWLLDVSCFRQYFDHLFACPDMELNAFGAWNHGNVYYTESAS